MRSYQDSNLDKNSVAESKSPSFSDSTTTIRTKIATTLQLAKHSDLNDEDCENYAEWLQPLPLLRQLAITYPSEAPIADMYICKSIQPASIGEIILNRGEYPTLHNDRALMCLGKNHTRADGADSIPIPHMPLDDIPRIKFHLELQAKSFACSSLLFAKLIIDITPLHMELTKIISEYHVHPENPFSMFSRECYGEKPDNVEAIKTKSLAHQG